MSMNESRQISICNVTLILYGPLEEKYVTHHCWTHTIVHWVLCEGFVDVHQSSSSCISCSSSWAFDNTATTLKPSISHHLYHYF